LGALSSQCTDEIRAFDMVFKKDGSRYCPACGNGAFTATPSFYTAPQLFTVGDTDEDGDRTEEREQIGSQSSRIPPKDTKDHDSRWYEGCRAMTTRGTPSYLVRLPSSPASMHGQSIMAQRQGPSSCSYGQVKIAQRDEERWELNQSPRKSMRNGTIAKKGLNQPDFRKLTRITYQST